MDAIYDSGGNVAESEDKIMQFVEEALEKNPDIVVKDLYAEVQSTFPEAAELSLRQFNARFPLQVKRRKNRGKGPKKSKPRKKRPAQASARAEKAGKSTDRDRFRSAFLSFAMALTAAEEKKDLVKVLANIDRYIDQAMDIEKK